MKNLLLLATLSLSLSSQAQTVPYGRCDSFSLHQPNLVAHYNFSGISSSGVVPDLSGHGNTGMLTGLVATTTDAGGNPGCALQFPGIANNHVRINSSTDFDFVSHPATISVWYLSQETASGKYEQLAGRGLGFHSGSYGAYSLALYDCRRPVASINSGSCWDSLVVASPCDTSGPYRLRWNHVVVVFNNSGSGSSYPAAVYLNGIAKTGRPGTGALSIDTGNLYLGDNFKGYMDEVRIYNTAFTASDVSALYAYGIMGCCTSTTSLPETKGDTKVLVYPNPSAGQFRVSVPQALVGGRFHIFNSLGQKVFQTSILGNNESLDLQQLPAGIYTLDCSNAAGDTHIQAITEQVLIP